MSPVLSSVPLTLEVWENCLSLTLTYCLRPGGCTAETPLRSEGKIQKAIHHRDYISALAGSWGGLHRRVPSRLQTQRSRIRRKNLRGEGEEHFPWYFQPKSLV